MEKCSACPLGSDRVCIAHTLSPRFCELAAKDRERQARNPSYVLRNLNTILEQSEYLVTPAEAGREMVVSRYREDLGWLTQVDMPITVYNKGGHLGLYPGHITVKESPNVGREAHAYLFHIVKNYDHLADLVFLAQASPFEHSPDFLDRLNGEFTEPTSLSIRYLPDAPSEEIKKLDRIETVNGHLVRYGRADIHEDEPERAWFDPAAWDYVFSTPRPSPQWFGYAALWAIPRETIQARPLGFWRWLLNELERPESCCGSKSKTTPPINPWSMEALWYYLLRPEFATHAHAVLNDPQTAQEPHEPLPVMTPSQKPKRELPKKPPVRPQGSVRKPCNCRKTNR